MQWIFKDSIPTPALLLAFFLAGSNFLFNMGDMFASVMVVDGLWLVVEWWRGTPMMAEVLHERGDAAVRLGSNSLAQTKIACAYE